LKEHFMSANRWKRRLVLAVAALLLSTPGLHAQEATDAAELTRLLNEFLAGASRNDAAVHDRFWAEDLVYTGSSGRRVSKADILRDVRSAPPPKPGDPTTTYTAEEIRIRQYGTTAVVAFRLVGATERDGATSLAKYFNTGTFLKRDGKWQVVAWQATALPRPEEDARREVAAAESAFHHAFFPADPKALEALTAESFVWTLSTGEQLTRAQLLERVGSGQLKYSKVEMANTVISVHGDAAIVRGETTRQRAAAAAGGATVDTTPFTAHYTLTFLYRNGAWKAVAMHTSRP